jgi:hypothetical protein
MIGGLCEHNVTYRKSALQSFDLLFLHKSNDRATEKVNHTLSMPTTSIFNAPTTGARAVVFCIPQKIFKPLLWTAAVFFSMIVVLSNPLIAGEPPGTNYLAGTYSLPPISLHHLQTLTDTNGIHEFAHGTVPWQENGYCAEDVARALVAATEYERVTGKTDARPLVKIYLRYLQNSLLADEQLWNRQGRTLASGDSYGRILWGLGYAAAMHPDKEIAETAAKLFGRILPGYREKLGGYPIADAYAIQGLTAFVRKHPGGAAKAALDECVEEELACYHRHCRADWEWFDTTMTYDTGRFPLAMLLAFEVTGKVECRKVGLESLNFLLKVCFSLDGKQLRPVGNQGWYPQGGTPAQFDQQPVDAASIVDACITAARITGEKKYAVSASKAFTWFLGNNLTGAAIYDPVSGGCRDGLTATGANPNEGGESTIMYLIARCSMETLQMHKHHE